MPECGADPCTNTSLPLNGIHGCALCKVELHGPCGVFYSNESIKYQNICHRCRKNVVAAADASCSRNADASHSRNADDCQVDSSAASNNEQVTSQSVFITAVGTLKQVERNLVKNVDVKSITWGDIIVGDVKLQ